MGIEWLKPAAFIGSIVYALIGVIIFWLCFVIIDKITPYNLWEEIVVKQNRALALVVAAMCLGISLIVAAAIHGRDARTTRLPRFMGRCRTGPWRNPVVPRRPEQPHPPGRARRRRPTALPTADPVRDGPRPRIARRPERHGSATAPKTGAADRIRLMRLQTT